MTTSELIEQYFDNHAGKSSHIDAQLRLADQAIKDAGRCQERGDNKSGYCQKSHHRAGRNNHPIP